MNCAAPPPRVPDSGFRHTVMVRRVLPLSFKSKSQALIHSELGTSMRAPMGETQKAAHGIVDGFRAAKYSRSEELFVFRSFGLTCQ